MLIKKTFFFDLGNGKSFSRADTTEGELAVMAEVTVPIAKAGTLTTRTDNDTGTLTMSTGHGIVDADTIDLYWTGGCRRGMTVGTVSVNSVPIDGGSGDNLPIATTAIIVGKCTTQPFAFIGNNGVGYCIVTPARAQVVFLSSAPAEVDYAEVDPADNESPKIVLFSESNPLSGDTVANLRISHADITAAQIIKVYALAS